MQKTSASSSKAQQSNPESAMFDPVCGMDLSGSSDEIEQAKHKGTSYYFCSQECREKFEAAPDDFV